MHKKGFNWKARQIPKYVIFKNIKEKKIQLNEKELNIKEDKFDESNAFLLPSKKRELNLKYVSESKKKPLTKKQRRNFEKIVESKKKRANRADLLKKLEEVQASPALISKLISTSKMQTGKSSRSIQKLISTDNVADEPAHLIFNGAVKKRKYEFEESEMSRSSSCDTSDISTDDDEDNIACRINAENIKENDHMISQPNVIRTEESECTDTTPIINSINSVNSIKSDVTNSSIINESGLDKSKIEIHKTMCNNITTKSGQIKTDTIDASFSTPKFLFSLNRPEGMEEKRQKLPVCEEEQRIVEAINDNSVVIICGETGSGKTTQVPQFLYEAGYTRNDKIIGVTEPRRVAATCMAKRVAYEMGLSEREVSYVIRYEGNATVDTKIKFMTDGVLLKEVQNDFELRKYSVIILDEAHERNVYTDILIGLLSRIVPLRQKLKDPLKLVIMSATLRVIDFTENSRLFNVIPPIIKIESRQFPVTVHFNKRTPFQDYIGEAYNKVCKIHRKLPEGGILVFVTSQQEIHLLSYKLKKIFSQPDNIVNTSETYSDIKNENRRKVKSDNEKEISDNSNSKCLGIQNHNLLNEDKINLISLTKGSSKNLKKICLDDFSAFPKDEDGNNMNDDLDDSDAEMNYLNSSAEDNDEDINDEANDEAIDDRSFNEADNTKNVGQLYVLPFYSLLSNEKQAKVFQPTPIGHRLCVIATNVAETSITIPGIKYVVDTGKVKTKYYDCVTGVSMFRVTNISQASANQRSGRAGRTGPGHCYRLYSSAVFTDFEKFSFPEITIKPVDDLVLQMKDIGIEKVINFPFPTPPPIEALEKAEKLLHKLGALDLKTTVKYIKRKRVSVDSYTLNDLGRTMARIPVAPRYARMLTLGHQKKLLPYVVALVAALSVQEMFLDKVTYNEDDFKRCKFQQLRKSWLGKGEPELLGDACLLLKAICAFECEENQIGFCEENGLRYKAMIEARKLRRQLTNTLCSIIPNLDLSLDPKLPPPTDFQCRFLRQILLSGLVDHIARKLERVDGLTLEEQKKRKNAYEDIGLVDHVFIHPSSVVFKNRPEYVVYQTMEESSKLYMKGVTAIEIEWLPTFLSSETHLTSPQFDDPNFQPFYDSKSGFAMYKASGTFGAQFWTLPTMDTKLPNSIDGTRWFVKFFLEGLVFKKLQPFCPHLLSTPSTMVKSWAHLQPRTSILLKAFLDLDITNRKALTDIWKKDTNYLLKEFCYWLPENQHSTVLNIWPPL